MRSSFRISTTALLVICVQTVGCDLTDSAGEAAEGNGSLELPSNDPKYRRVRFGETTLRIPVRYRASITGTSIRIHTYWPGLPAHDDGFGRRDPSAMVEIYLQPTMTHESRLPSLNRIERSLNSGRVAAPIFDPDLGLHVYVNKSGQAEYYRPSLDDSGGIPTLVFVCSDNPHLDRDRQRQCRGYTRIEPTVELEYRFNVNQMLKWKELSTDIHALVQSYVEKS